MATSKSNIKNQSLGVCWSQLLALTKSFEEEFETEVLEVCKNKLKNNTGRRRRKKNPESNLKTGINSQNDLSSIVEEPGSSLRVSQRSAAKRATEKTSILLKQTLIEKLRNTDVDSKNSKKKVTDDSAVFLKQKSNVSTKNETSGSESNKRLNGPTTSSYTGKKRESNENNDESYESSKFPKESKATTSSMKHCSIASTKSDRLSLSNNNSEGKSTNNEDIAVIGNCSESGSPNKKENRQDPEKSESNDVKFSSCFVLLNRDDVPLDKSNKDELNTVENLNSPQRNVILTEPKLNKKSNIEKDNLNVNLFVNPSESEKVDNDNKRKYTSDTHLNTLNKQSPKSETKFQINGVGGLDTDKINLKLPADAPTKETIPLISVSLNLSNQEECKKADQFVQPNSIRPKRNVTKNKFFDYSCSLSLISHKDFSHIQEKGIQDKALETSGVIDNEPINESTTSKKGRKRKSEEDINNKPLKHSKFLKESETTNMPGHKSNCTEVSSKFGLSPSSDTIRSGDVSKDKQNTPHEISGCATRTRTRTNNKQNVNNSVIAPISSEHKFISDKEEDINKEPPVIRITPPSPLVQRMTRTRTRELTKNQNQTNQDLIISKNDNTKNAIRNICEKPLISGKENIVNNIKLVLSNGKKLKTTPLATNNNLFSPTPGTSFMKPPIKTPTPLKINSGYKKIDGSSSKVIAKEIIAQQKKKELIKARTEESKRKRKEKEQRILAHRQAVEKEAKEKLAKLQKETEDRERLLAESKRLKEEQLLQKKQNTEVMLKEAEERRLKEEEAKQSRIKKQEEEKKKQAYLRMKQAEEAKKLHEMRLAQEAEEKEARLKETEKQAKFKQKVGNVTSYELTPAKDEIAPRPPKNEDDYGLSEDSGDSTDDEKQPRKIIPKWAAKHVRSRQMIIQSYIHTDLISSYFPLVFDATLFDDFSCPRQRNSSAVWSTPIG